MERTSLLEMTAIDTIMQMFTEFSASPLFQKYAVIFIAIYAGTPTFIAIPNEAFIVPFIDGAIDRTSAIITVWVAVTVGGFLGDSLIYHLAKHGYRFVTKQKKEALHHRKWFHRFGVYIFVISPSVVILADVILIYAGVKHLRYTRLAPFLAVGNGIKATLNIAISFGIVEGIALLN